MKKVSASGAGQKGSSALDWLMGEEEPSIRYLALTQLLSKGEED
jgi:hypothetical protein